LANTKSTKKRIKQNEKRHIKNNQVRSSIRTASKKTIKAIETDENINLETIHHLYKNFVKSIDTASRKRIIHWKTAARKKSRLAKKINSLSQQ